MLDGFVWDPAKAEANWRKHRVRFVTAARVFLDPLAVTHLDRIDDGEYRWRTIGAVEGMLLLVAHTDRKRDGKEVIRIISARRTGPRERRLYEAGHDGFL